MAIWPFLPTGKHAGKELFRPGTESFFSSICMRVSSKGLFVASAMESAFEIWVAEEGKVYS